jgi:hypothetical protein
MLGSVPARMGGIARLERIRQDVMDGRKLDRWNVCATWTILILTVKASAIMRCEVSSDACGLFKVSVNM